MSKWRSVGILVLASVCGAAYTGERPHAQEAPHAVEQPSPAAATASQLCRIGANDHLVPPDATDRFAQQARNAGIDIESIRFPYGDHAFNLNQYGAGNQFYLGMTYRFLSEHGQRPANSKPDRE
jgi:dienelactone hydrolase